MNTPMIKQTLHQMMHHTSKLLLLSPLILAQNVANANTIVNIKGAGDGVTVGSGANIYSYPVAVGTNVTLQNPVLIPLAAGDYQLTDAWGQPGALYDTWNFQATVAGSWASHYVAAEPGSNGSYNILLDVTSLLDPTCKNHFCAWDTEAQATTAFLNAPVAHLHLTHDTTVAFASADYYLPDNLGGISLSISSVPLPASVWFLGTGLLGLWKSRRQQLA